jgi:quercetin dioxygenase-like cupin family protein
MGGMSMRMERRPIRRVVTGHRADGGAVTLLDGPVENESARDGRIRTALWFTDGPRADIAAGERIEDTGTRPGPAPYADGTRFVVFDFPPGHTIGTHRTETVDYVVVLDGEMQLDLDDGTVVLHAGDTVVQRGTNHAWANRSNAPTRIAVVMVPARPLGVSPETTRAQT